MLTHDVVSTLGNVESMLTHDVVSTLGNVDSMLTQLQIRSDYSLKKIEKKVCLH